MPSFQEFPQSIWPDTGDVTSAIGDSNLVVAGIQRVPVSPTPPLDQQVLVYEQALGQYVPGYSPDNLSILVNGSSVSDDYWVFVNFADTEVQVNSSYPPNGFPILANGTAIN